MNAISLFSIIFLLANAPIKSDSLKKEKKLQISFEYKNIYHKTIMGKDTLIMIERIATPIYILK